ncbi:hypothetical protein [Chishuiella sp.]|uniref:hypothetical protein n=1 Tax=Chishuiella sp. TaxID=1969467 RepID=UPI0028A70DDD|nr:hypothetical protein [Chishuiella sp.]
MKIKFFFFSFLLLLFSCSYESLGKREKNIWIGAYLDEAGKYPNNMIYNSDSIFTYKQNIIKKKIEDKSKFAIINDSISKFSINVGLDTINLFYKKARNTNFKFSFKDLIISGWETREKEEDESLEKLKKYIFNKDSTLIIQTNYIYNNKILYSEVENYNYRFIAIDKTYILQIYSDNNFSYFAQIIQKSKKTFTIELLNYIRPKQIQFSQTDKNIPTIENKFNLCFEYFIFEYFNNYRGTKFKGGLKEIKKIFADEYNYSTNKEKQNGYIRIRFIVNCDGKMGHFSVMELNDNYLPYSFDSGIVLSLFKITTTDLKDGWIPGTSDNNPSQKYDNYKHLTFKIKEGKIIDILP